MVVPFLERLIDDFPVIGYPATPPEPPLEDLLDGRTIEVAFDDVVTQCYRQGDPNKVILVNFVSNRVKSEPAGITTAGRRRILASWVRKTNRPA